MSIAPIVLAAIAAEIEQLAAAHAAHCDAPSEGALLQVLRKHLAPAETPVCPYCKEGHNHTGTCRCGSL